jgi:hypothetical protein
MCKQANHTAVMEKDGKGMANADRRIYGNGVPAVVRQIRENETIYAVVTPVKQNG